jgi:hypothetical protein
MLATKRTGRGRRRTTLPQMHPYARDSTNSSKALDDLFFRKNRFVVLSKSKQLI